MKGTDNVTSNLFTCQLVNLKKYQLVNLKNNIWL